MAAQKIIELIFYQKRAIISIIITGGNDSPYRQTKNMKHAQVSYRTKLTMTASLKKFMQTKPLSKITISDICSDCGINRKTFYYHFDNIFDLLRWMLDQEAIEVVKRADLINDSQKVLNFTIDYIEENKHILNCAYDALGRDSMRIFLNSDLNGVISLLISELEAKLNVTMDKGYRSFVCDFYTNAISGILIDWFRSEEPLSRDELIRYLVFTIRSSLIPVIV